MANPHKGEVEFQAEGVTYTLRFSISSIVKLEEVTGRNFPVIAQELATPEKISMTLVRQLFWAGLQDSHPGLDIEAAGELISEAGGMVGAMALIGEALNRSFQKEAGGRGRPRKPGRQ